MPSGIEKQIRQNVRAVGEGRLSLDDFQRWFVPISWDIEASQDHSVIALVHGIDGILAESSAAHWSESDLREELAKAIRPFVSRQNKSFVLADVFEKRPRPYASRNKKDLTLGDWEEGRIPGPIPRPSLGRNLQLAVLPARAL